MTITTSSLALTCFTLLAAGYVLFAVLGQVKSLAPVIREAWPILLMETLIVGSAAGAFWIGGWVLTIALLALAARTGYEAAKVAGLRHSVGHPARIGGAIIVLALLASFVPMPLLAIAAPGAAALVITAIRAQKGKPDNPIKVALDLALFPVLPLVVFTAAGLQGLFETWLLIAFILVETFDSYALLGGKLFGKHKAFPILSPNKTIEGLAIGAVMLMLTAAGIGALLAGLPVLASAGIALFAGALTLAGDLLASRLKRLSGVKDYPQVLPHQGGLLDITDAWIVTGAGLVCLVTALRLV